ncbi:tellurium resistance protein TerW [Rouxiella chamberiensis]|uniref:Tellurium resistance protein TerW n=1 Tax=Rouxiella chamberiensis TaxID=1513468 RepID=A0ABY7HR81_9GAMM|nr:tellurium resistance protein TerW [Rouxiella chamberiensis]WAT01860.1 tellurium resistance protein TerW [Rouxiella chamberiensis]
MQISTRQARIFRLALLLSSGQPVSSEKIISQLACSEPTLTRALKELRDSYSAEIKYSKAAHTYQLVENGQLDKKALRWMTEALNASVSPISPAEKGVSLSKVRKKAVSLSLRTSVLRKIDQLAQLANTTRSDAVELLADRYIAELAEAIKAQSGTARK